MIFSIYTVLFLVVCLVVTTSEDRVYTNNNNHIRVDKQI